MPAHYGIADLAAANLSFYQKAKLLPDAASSAAFVKPGILQLNAIRNKFGHTLDFEIEPHQLSAIYEVLSIARRGTDFRSAVDAIEAFCPVACAFLAVPPKHLQKLFMEAFSDVHTRNQAMHAGSRGSSHNSLRSDGEGRNIFRARAPRGKHSKR